MVTLQEIENVGEFVGLRVLICTLIVLHALDIHSTFLAGGLAAEGNVIVAYIWVKFGLVVILLIKILSVLLFAAGWNSCESIVCKNVFRLLLGTVTIAPLAVVAAHNYWRILR